MQNRFSRRIAFATITFAALSLTLPCLAQTTEPIIEPPMHPATQPTTQAVISPAAQSVLDQVRIAYAKINTLEVSGTYAIDADAGGQQTKEHTDFTAAFQAPNKFRHEMKDDVTVVDTGDKIFSLLLSRNQFVTDDAPKERTANLPEHVGDLMHEQNPSLCLALASDAGKELATDASAIDKIADVQVDGQTYTALKLAQSDRDVVALIDSKSGLLRQMQIDLRKMLEQQQVPQVKHAQITIDYARSTPDGAIEAAKFAFIPPTGATPVKAEAVAQAADDQEADPAKELVGKAAPAFKLEDANAKEISPPTDQKGSVIVLDFWATWCPPCRAGLPHLDQLYKDRQGDGLKVFAINLREDKQKVQQFLTEQKLSLPVLFDFNGATGAKYHVSGIPQTVLIGKDGNVREVFVGFGDEIADALAKAVDAAFKAK